MQAHCQNSNRQLYLTYYIPTIIYIPQYIQHSNLPERNTAPCFAIAERSDLDSIDPAQRNSHAIVFQRPSAEENRVDAHHDGFHLGWHISYIHSIQVDYTTLHYITLRYITLPLHNTPTKNIQTNIQTNKQTNIQIYIPTYTYLLTYRPTYSTTYIYIIIHTQ